MKRTAGCSGSEEIRERVKQCFFAVSFERSKRTSIGGLTKLGSQSTSSVRQLTISLIPPNR
ncbi:hypothetical protein FOWG_18117 [Fusarium oxysporum f. sp. lycopersici MN25]|nr:hypothetical protein FOWG_18117 [Fusarium oxysporum f. sp. lycopersici MN25]